MPSGYIHQEHLFFLHELFLDSEYPDENIVDKNISLPSFKQNWAVYKCVILLSDREELECEKFKHTII